MNARLSILVVLAGCGKDGPAEPTPPAETVILTDENNYTYVADLTLASTDLQAGAVNTVDWSGITVDYRGRPVDPASIDRVTIASMTMDVTTLIDRINRDELTQTDVDNYREFLNPGGATTAAFDSFEVLEGYFEPEVEFLENPGQSWLITLWSLNERGIYEILSSQVVVPLDAATNTVVTWSNDAAVLEVDADLGTAPAAVTPAGADRYALNWATVDVDVHGAAFDEYLADTLRIAHFPATDVADVEAAFLQLDVAADQTYFADVWASRSVDDLSVAEALDGTPFPGFTEDGTWIVSLECTALSCFSPAPMYIAVVEVGPAE